MCEVRDRIIVDSVNYCDIQLLAQAPHPNCSAYRSTQPSTRSGTVKWVSAFRLSNNNKWRLIVGVDDSSQQTDSWSKPVGHKVVLLLLLLLLLLVVVVVVVVVVVSKYRSYKLK